MFRSAIGSSTGIHALLLALVMLAIASPLLSDSKALACSVAPDFDQIDNADVIVAGRFTGWDYAPGVTFPASYGDDIESNLPLTNVPFNAHLTVDAVYKGDAPATLDVYDTSLDVYDHEPRYVWTGAHGACGAFTFDPTDVYAVVTLSRSDDGVYRSFIFGWMYVGDEPAGPDYEEAIGRLRERGLDPREPGENPDEGLSQTQIAGLLGAITLAVATVATLRRFGSGPRG